MAPSRPKSSIPGITKCKRCAICPYVRQGKKVRSTAAGFTVEIEQQVNYQTKNTVHCIQCKQCCIKYIGETQKSLQESIAEHKGYITRAFKQKATGEHFNIPGHRVADMEVTIIEKIFNEGPQKAEKLWAETFKTKYKRAS